MRGVPAYKKVVNRLNSLVDRQGWIPALDGGRLHVRSAHKALNTSLQSAGALVAKQWACGIEDSLIDSGWEHGWDGDFAILGFFHDELQIAIRAPKVDPNYYTNPTDYTGWEEKKAAKDKKRHLQDWYYNESPEIRRVAAATKSVIKGVEKHFEFVCPLDCEYIVGRNWADCH